MFAERLAKVPLDTIGPPTMALFSPSAKQNHPHPACRRLRSLLDCARMSDRHLTRIRQLTALCLLLCAVVTFGLAIAGALKGGRSPVPQLASHK